MTKKEFGALHRNHQLFISLAVLTEKNRCRSEKKKVDIKKRGRKIKDPYKQAWAEVEAVLNSGVDEPNAKMVEVGHKLREHPDWKPEQILKEVGFTKKDLADLRKVIKAMKKGDVMC